MGTGSISIRGNSSGFVYNNNGSIEDCYSNILVYGIRASGFVFYNAGNIHNVYTMSSVRLQDSNNYPFISMKKGTNNREINMTDNSTVVNAYFLKATVEELNKASNEGLKEDSFNVEDALQLALPTSIEKFTNYNTFESFAFAPNYDDVSNSEVVVEELVRSVWFYPNAVSAGSNYFQKSDYHNGAPQLVTANLDTYSLRYYVSDNSNKIIETIYSDLLTNYNTGLSEFKTSFSKLRSSRGEYSGRSGYSYLCKGKLGRRLERSKKLEV